MSAVLQAPRVDASGPLDHVWQAWRSLRRRELAWFLWFGGVIGGMNALSLADGSIGGRHPGLMATETLMPMVAALLLMLVWLPADRSNPAHPRRVHRMVLAVVLASAINAGLSPVLIQVLDLPTVLEFAYREKGKPPPAWPATALAEFLAMLMPSGLAIGVIEMMRRQQRSEHAMAQALHEHAALARSALESRLAAMQAQVEPQFLFDVLVDIERLYGAASPSGTPQAAAAPAGAVALMDRLITYLRVALPRLRESGSSLGAEVDLLASYLDLVQALHGGRPGFHAQLPEALRAAVFHPMLLLPLVQRAVRSDGPMPSHVELRVQAVPQGVERPLEIVLTIAAPGLCAADAELQRLRERLDVLYEGRARLACEELATDGMTITRFVLTVPRTAS